MIAYFDASALVKLLIEEPGSITAEQAWYAADARICCSVGMAEVAAAVGRAMRMGRIDSGTAHGILTDLETVWSAVTRMPCDDRLAAEAAQLAVLHGLRGFDAVHLAAALGGRCVGRRRRCAPRRREQLRPHCHRRRFVSRGKPD